MDFLKNFLGKKAQLSKDGHDLSNNEVTSLPFGVWRPIKKVFCVPNEHYKINVSGYVQTAPMREDNFQQINSRMKAVFVPMSSLCRDYLEMTSSSRSTRKDEMLNFEKFDIRIQPNDLIVPVCAQFCLLRSLESALSLISHLFEYQWDGRVGDFIDFNGDSLYQRLSSLLLNHPDLLLFYDCVASLIDYNSDVVHSSDIIEIPIFFQKINGYFQSLSGCAQCTDFIRLWDSLGFGNLLPLFETVFYDLSRSRTSEHIYPIRSSSQFNFYHIAQQINNNYGPLVPVESDSVSFFPFLAYQFYQWTCERSNYRLADTLVLTADYFYNLHENGSLPCGHVNDGVYYPFDEDSEDVGKCFLDTDFVNLAYQDLENRHINLGSLILYSFSLLNPLLDSDVYTSSQLSVVYGSAPTTSSSELQQNLVKAYADASALYSLRQDLLRAGVRRDKQMQAIFGVKGNQHVIEPCSILDDTTSQVKIQSLINQAETAEAPLGARAAKGNGSMGLNFEFNTEDFGYLFIVQSFTCESYYESFGVDRSNLLSISSWFNPKFNHLGLEPINSEVLSIYKSSGYNSNSDIVDHSPSVIGFTARNFELKQDVNKVHDFFTNFRFPVMDSQLVTGQYNKYRTQSLRGNSIFGGYVSTLIDQQVGKFSHAGLLYFKPYMMNNIFVDQVDGVFNSQADRDYFRCVYHYEIHKVSPMPKIGLFRIDV